MYSFFWSNTKTFSILFISVEQKYLYLFSQAGGKVDASELTEKIQTIQQLREEIDEKNAEIEGLRESNDEVSQKLTATRFQVKKSHFMFFIL